MLWVTYCVPMALVTAPQKSGVSESVAVTMGGIDPLLSCLYSDRNVAAVCGSAEKMITSGRVAMTRSMMVEYEAASPAIVTLMTTLPPSFFVAAVTPGRLPSDPMLFWNTIAERLKPFWFAHTMKAAPAASSDAVARQ